MKTLKNTFTILLIVLFTTVASCKNETHQEKQAEKIEYINKENGSVGITEFYDESGNKIKLINHSEEYGNTEKTFLYDNLNKLIEEKEFDTKGELKETKFYEYNSVSDQEFFELTYEQRKGSEKKLIVENKLEYNNDGNLFKKTHRAVFGNWVYHYKYHANNKLKEEIIFAYEETEKSVIIYNEKGKRDIERIFRRKTKDDNFELKQTNQWYYNENGEEVTSEGKVIVLEEAFTKKITYHN